MPILATPNTPSKSINAWILLSEDDPAGSNYHSPNSSYQSLINHGVYGAVDMLAICFFQVVPQLEGGATLRIDRKDHPGGSTSEDYLRWVVSDARAGNPSIRLLATLGYGADQYAPLFQGPESGWAESAAAFARNALAFLQAHDLDGLDVDWEASVDTSISRKQFAALFQALRFAFAQETERYYYLTLSPANQTWNMGAIDAPTVNACFDFVNLQLYCEFISAQQYASAGLTPALLQYGAKFEANGAYDPNPYQTAQEAWREMQAGYTWNARHYTYTIATQWRLNSGNFQFEQAQQLLLYQLAYGTPAGGFNDGPIAGAAGGVPITQLVVRAGEVLDGLQATNTGHYKEAVLTYTMPAHGGPGGAPTTIVFDAGDVITGVSGYTGMWYGWSVVLQLTVTTRQKKNYGPFGSMRGATAKTPFSLGAPAGQSIVAFRGSVVQVPEAGGGHSRVIATLGVVCA